MNGCKATVRKRIAALAIFVGALPFCFNVHTYAQELSETNVQEVAVSNEPSGASKWLDDYRQPVGLTYDAEAVLNAGYIWRGLYAGGMNIQPTASVGYGGLYLRAWWNIGVTDWTFRVFQPELDLVLGFNRWGLNLSVVYIYNFNCGFFDFANYADKGNRLEIDLKYTVSSKIPLSVLWATRIAASDGYQNEKGEVIRAYSSYAEISYVQALPYDLKLRGAFGITPWRSLYSHFKQEFAVANIEVSLRKDWDMGHRCGLMIQGLLSINPSVLAADRTTAKWLPRTPERQSINANIAFGVYLK